MNFIPTKLAGAYVIEPELHVDERGFFARSFCEEEFAAHGLPVRFVQCNISYNKSRGTLRGMHFNEAPHEESKVVRCTAGEIYDVILDLRSGSDSFGVWQAFTLTAENHRMLFVPKGLAHGFLTLSDKTEVAYQMSDFFVKGVDSGVRWNDPFFKIDWPLSPTIISQRDANYPLWVTGRQAVEKEHAL